MLASVSRRGRTHSPVDDGGRDVPAQGYLALHCVVCDAPCGLAEKREEICSRYIGKGKGRAEEKILPVKL
jgi:hypothetical protein